MPSFDKHKFQAEHNEKLATFLNTTQRGAFNDWVVTVCFYSAVHLVEAMVFKCRHLRVPADTGFRYPKNRPVPMVKRSGVTHTSDLHDHYTKSGHELRDCVIRDNRWYFGDVGTTCAFLRKESQTARYECQQIIQDDADKAVKELSNAIRFFNEWVMKSHNH